MHREMTQTGDTTRVSFTGVWTMDEFEPNKALLEQLEGSGATSVEYDLSGVPAIDSAGIGMLILANDRLGKAGVEFRISGSHGAVAQIFEVAKIGDLITLV